MHDETETPAAIVARRSTLEVERRAASTLSYREFLREYVDKNQPLVIEGAASAWPAIGKWTPEYFKSSFGSMMVHVSHTDKRSFSNFIEAILASTPEKPGPYMYRFFIGVHLPELLQDLTPSNPYCFPRRLASPLMPKSWRRPDGYLKLLIGGAGGSFPVMHFDGENMHAAITEIYGDKEFVLYRPEDAAYLYPKPEAPNLSQIANLEQPDLTRFPLFPRATQYRTVLKPGETIFVPSRWWHTARVLTPSISVCTNQLDRSNWSGFVRELCQYSAPVKRQVKTAILTTLGLVLYLLEQLGRRDSILPEAIGAPIGRLSPWSPAEAAPWREWPVSQWWVR